MSWLFADDSPKLTLKLWWMRVANIIEMSTMVPTKTPVILKPKHECPFAILVDDVLVQIIRYLTHRDVWSLVLVSKRYNALATPFAYSDIRLLISPCKLSGTGKVHNKTHVQRGKKRLLATLAAHPHLKVHVKTLAWHLDALETVSDFIQLIAPMKNIQTLHVARSYRLHKGPYGPHEELSFTAGTLSALLPACINISIEGVTDLEFAKHVIHVNQLEQLVLDSAIQVAIPILRWISTTELPRLTTLCLRGPGGRKLINSEEMLLLEAWKKLLLSVHAVLEDLTLSVRKPLPLYEPVLRNFMVAQPAPHRLVQTLWPVFLQNRFPRLRLLTLTGMNIGNGNGSSISLEHLQEIRSVVPYVIVADDTHPANHLWNPLSKSMKERMAPRVGICKC